MSSKVFTTPEFLDFISDLKKKKSVSEIYIDIPSRNLNYNIILWRKLNISINSETSKPEEKSKGQKVIHFFCKFFHKSPTTSSSTSSGANNVLPVEPLDIDGEPPNFRDGAISLLKSRRGSSVRDVYLGKKLSLHKNLLKSVGGDQKRCTCLFSNQIV